MATGVLPDRVVKNWSGKGKDDAVALFTKSYKTQPTGNEGGTVFRGMFYDLLKLSLTDQVDAEDVADVASQLVTNLDSGKTIPSLLVDLLSIIDAEISCSETKSHRTQFKALVQSLVTVVGEELLKERLDMDTLEQAHLIPSKTAFNQKYVKTKTKLFYKQQKFNLFREESEGYSKLLAELVIDGGQVSPETVLDNIKSLIGRFSLDPNRVLDILLEAFECQVEEREMFAMLLRQYPCEPSTFVNILGFKFQAYQDADSTQASTTPSSLYQLAAVLVEEKLVDLDALYSHLSLSDTQMKELHDNVVGEAQEIARKANIVTLTERSDEEKEKEAEQAQSKKDTMEILLSVDVNQKLGLCHACLEQGSWECARQLFTKMPPLLGMWCDSVVKATCELLHHCVEPLYRSYAPRGTRDNKYTQTRPLPQCSRFDDMLPNVTAMFCQLGPHLHTDPVLLCKLVRLGRAYLKEALPGGCGGVALSARQLEKDLLRDMVSLLDEVILPSLSLLPCNSGVAEEVWSMLKLLPYETRYMLYGYWKNKSYDRHPELVRVRTDILTRAKYIMKRLTKDNVKPSGRQIGKLSHSNPGIVFSYVLSQIQKYDNIIIPVVDSLKYLTPLAYDVLAYCVIEALGNPQKERLKHEDTNISSWLQGLANFCANVFKKYPIELTGLLQYVANQLKAGKSFDLLVLKEVVQKMAGIDISDETTTSQLEAMAGGELLKAEGGYFSQVRNTKKSSQRLREALVDSNLCLPLCLLTAQQRDCIVYRDGSKRHLKLVCMLLDHCMDTLVQFGGFLSSHLSPEEYAKRVPSLDQLVDHYHMPADVCFFLYRPKITSAINLKCAELEKAAKTDGQKQDKKSVIARQEKHYQTACDSVFVPMVTAVKMLHTPKVWEDISCKFYIAFWSLSLYDLYVPRSRYEEEIVKAKDAMQALEDNQDVASSKKKKEQERSQALIEKLQEERRRQEDNHQLVLSWIRQEKESWFSPRVTKNRTITQFLQLCVFPRVCFTTNDAIYCAKFVQTLHSLETPHFSTLLFLDRVFADISYTVACCTENEVRRYGLFLHHLLDAVSRWHTTESCYNDECGKTIGFISMMKAGTSNDKTYLDYENFRHITFKWHFKMTKSLVVCLESQDYVQIRNGLIVLTKVLPHYPKVQHLSMALEKRVLKIMEEEKDKRHDLYALAIGYAGMLKTQKQHLIAEQDFHRRDDRIKAIAENETKPSSKLADHSVSNGHREEKVKQEKSRSEDAVKAVSRSRPSVDEVRSSTKVSAVAAQEKTEVKKEKEREERKRVRPTSSEGDIEAKVKEREEKKKVSPASSDVTSTTTTGETGAKGKEKEREEKKKVRPIATEVGTGEAEAKGKEKEEKKKIRPSVLDTDKSISRASSSDGSSASSPARVGQRRQHTASSDGSDTPLSDKASEVKRRKVAEAPKASPKTEVAMEINSDKKPKIERKRERSLEKDQSSPLETVKKRKSLPENSTTGVVTKEPSSQTKAIQEKRKILQVKVAKTDARHKMKSPASEKDEENGKKHLSKQPLPSKK